MPTVFRTPEDRFAAWVDFPFTPHRHRWRRPEHFVWGVHGDVFTEQWGQAWTSRFPQATFDPVDAGHVLQESHGHEVADLILQRIAEE
ncbi:MAG: hypothetical protein KF911_13280 [Pseudomonadales bacterium]|nr:hypothetical protein [Pseudomonadales bacterium]